jgi:hypothetical protein
MDAPSRMLSTTVDTRLLSGFLMGSRNNDKLLVSHLLFVDDTLIFCEASPDHLHYLCIYSNAFKLSRG